MSVWDTPYEQVIKAKTARATLEKLRGISDTDWAFLRLSNDPKWQKYNAAQEFLREYEQKYFK